MPFELVMKFSRAAVTFTWISASTVLSESTWAIVRRLVIPGATGNASRRGTPAHSAFISPISVDRPQRSRPRAGQTEVLRPGTNRDRNRVLSTHSLDRRARYRRPRHRRNQAGRALKRIRAH